MKLWRLGKDDTLNTTETRAVLAVKLTIWTYIFLAAFAVVALLVFLITKKVVNPSDFWLWVLTIALSFNAALHGIAWGSGYTKQKTSETVAKADAIRAGAPPSTTTETLTKSTGPTAVVVTQAAPAVAVPAPIPTPEPPPTARDD